MRFKRGSKVEVMSKKEALISWRCAEIISGNGHTYSVKYDDCYPGSTNEVVERVSRKAIRPCPPSMEGVESSAVGDVVDVFDNFSWKIATVLKVLDRDHYLVRLLGIPQEFRIHKSNIRVRQSWEDSKWVVIGKGSGSCEDVKANKLSTSICYYKTSFQKLQANTKIKLQAGDDLFAAEENAGLQEPYMVSSGTLKRASPYRSCLLDACTGNFQKIRAIEKEGPQLEACFFCFQRSKGLMLGLLPFSWHKQWGNICIHCLTNKPIHGQPLGSVVMLFHLYLSFQASFFRYVKISSAEGSKTKHLEKLP